MKVVSTATNMARWMRMPRRRVGRLVGMKGSVRVVIITIWLIAVLYAERIVFETHLADCDWRQWEQWPADADPTRVVLVADPQLVDPHTYPHRPGLFERPTMAYADQFLRRSFDSILTTTDPDAVLFLGDLMDGGREWGSRTSHSAEPRWRRFGPEYWLSEFERFAAIFFAPLATPRPDGTGRKVVVGLPGNHDIGIGAGVQLPVRARFSALLGEGNRVDVIGNHSFVSIDGLSLTARDDPRSDELESVWRPPTDFLDTANAQIGYAVKQEIRHLRGSDRHARFEHRVADIGEPNFLVEPEGEDIEAEAELESELQSRFPAVLLSHVPLFRLRGTPCGPLRERHPPSPGHPETDNRNAITIAKGYQYQNVLTAETSRYVVSSIDRLRYAFSGDDHDYCDVVHPVDGRDPVREITVKSLSWAMGMRRPGFVMLSLWNPVLGTSSAKVPRSTMQAHLCLMPDQLGLFQRYLSLLGLTVVVLGIKTRHAGTDNRPLLPVTDRARHRLAVVPGVSPAGSSTGSTPSSAQESTDFPAPAGRRRNTVSRPGGTTGPGLGLAIPTRQWTATDPARALEAGAAIAIPTDDPAPAGLVPPSAAGSGIASPSLPPFASSGLSVSETGFGHSVWDGLDEREWRARGKSAWEDTLRRRRRRILTARAWAGRLGWDLLVVGSVVGAWYLFLVWRW